jgi:hypothetical protein
MNAEELKTQICGLVDSALATAKVEGHDEIVFPFSLVIHDNGEVDYLPYNRHNSKNVKNTLTA